MIEQTTATIPKLYIIMREDLWDNSPGKMMAQAAHAQADFDAYVEDTYSRDSEFRSAHIQWCADRNFGATIVLSAHGDEFRYISNNVAHAGVTIDPTYPYKNYYGKLFVRQEATCMWVFAVDQEDVDFMKKYQLHG